MNYYEKYAIGSLWKLKPYDRLDAYLKNWREPYKNVYGLYLIVLDESYVLGNDNNMKYFETRLMIQLYERVDI